MSQEANSLTTGNNELISVDYSNLLNKILQALKNKQSKDLFKISPCGTRLLIDIDSIASQVCQLQVDNPLGASVNSVKTATVNFNPGFKENFPDKIKEIRDCLSRQLQESINQSTNSLSSLSIEEFVNNLITDLQTFKGSSSKLDFTYPFAPYKGLEKQRLTFSDKNLKAREVLRFHKLTITVQKTNELNEQLQAGLAKYIDVKFGEEEEIEELEYVLEDLYKERNNRESDFYKLKRIVDTETLGKLKKQAQINYLEFLHENIKSDNNSNNVTAAIYLEDTIRRLKLIEEYINDVSKADGHYKVYYQGAELNYRDIFSRAEAFDMLPIIPKIEGYLGETKDETSGQIEFIFGVKLKFDGKAQAHGGKSSFQYYLNLLNPESKEHQTELSSSLNKDVFARKILRVVFLYYFMFASRSKFSGENYNPEVELSYDPIASFEQKFLPVFKGGSEEEKRALLIKICNFFEEFEIQKKINVLKKTLINLIKSPRNFTTREYPLHISIKESILESNIDTIINERNTFFQAVVRGNPKEVLKYINIGEANSNKNSLCTLPAKITIGDIHYATCDDKQSFSMEYDIANAKVNTLPILFIPFRNSQCQSIYQETIKQRKVVLFNYRLEEPKLDSQQAFIYKFTFSLLAYICLRILLQKQKWLFIPILRFHVNNKEDDAAIEKFIVSLSGVLSHLLNEKHRSNAQGIDIRDFKAKEKFKIPNVLSSLYSVLPKKFSFNNLLDCPKRVDKLAIIIVSSRESDRTWRGTQKISNLMGEILSFSCKDGAVRIQLMKTFSENYANQEMFQRPTVVVDEVAKLHKKGFRHFLYIAKAPYTSTLNMTQTEDDDGLFFMSREVIKAFRAKHDNIKIYPMFFDKYFAVKIGDRDKIRSSSLYIQDTAELSNLVDDPSQQSVVFFNLFNGITVGKAEERNYNGVISYATLLNIYKGILDDEDIRKGLIYSGDLKNEILQYLTLFHFSRYEKAKEVNIKLDPYQNLIGDESVGALSLFNHMRGKGEFNSLAFLTEVKKVLNGELGVGSWE